MKTEEIAYGLWEKAGKPEGMSDYFWYLAESKKRYISFKSEEPESIAIKPIADVDNHLFPPIIFGDAPKLSFSRSGSKACHERIITKYGKKMLEEGGKYYGRTSSSD